MGGKGDGSAGGAVMYGGKSALGRSGGEPVGLLWGGGHRQWGGWKGAGLELRDAVRALTGQWLGCVLCMALLQPYRRSNVYTN